MDLNSPVGALTVAQLMDIMKMSGSEGGSNDRKEVRLWVERTCRTPSLLIIDRQSD